MSVGLKPFFRYYGGKWRAALRYPKPLYDTIVEPFAGAAGYSLRYPDKQVFLIEKYAVIAEIWDYLISADPAEILDIPEVEHVDDLPEWVPAGARHLVGFAMNAACVSPCRQLSSGRKKLRQMGRVFEGWSAKMKERVASQVPYIRHWCVIHGDFTDSPNVDATWFIDPPYQVKGSYYIHSRVDFERLGRWCRDRSGQTIVCENEGATWLPFKTFATLKAGINGKGSKEVIWTNGA